MLPTETLLAAFCRLEDPRSCRGIRHPFAGIVVLMLLGMLARIREMEVLVRWATIHWDQLKGPLGFDRDEPPCATTISRTLAQCQVGDFQAALSTWLRECLANSETEGVLAVDDKTAAKRQSRGSTTTVVHCICSTRLSMTCKQWLANGRPVRKKPTSRPCCVITWKNCSTLIRCCD